MRTMVIHGVLALFGLVLAWRLSTTEAEEGVSVDQVELFSCGELREAVYSTPSRTLTVKRTTDGDGAFHWLTVTPKTPGHESAGQAGSESPSVPVAAPGPGRQPSTYLVGQGEETTAWFDSLRPLTATRSLGDVSKDLLSDLGLSDTSDTLRLVCDGGTASYRVGASTFGSQGQRYLQRKEGGEVFLVAGDTITRLSQADSRLAQRALQTFEANAVVRLRVRAAGKSISLLQRDRHDPRAAVWVDEAHPEERNDLYGNWMTHVTGLTVRSYLPHGKGPGSDIEGAAGAPVEALQLDYIGENDEPLGSLLLSRVDDPRDPTKSHYYAKSLATRGWVTVPDSVARQAENNGRLVLGLDPLPEPVPLTPPPSSESPESPPGAATAPPPNPHS